MRRSTLAVLAAGSIFALTAAGAAGMSLTGANETITYPTTGSLSITTANSSACDNLAIDYSYNGDKTELYYIGVITSDTGCAGETIYYSGTGLATASYKYPDACTPEEPIACFGGTGEGYELPITVRLETEAWKAWGDEYNAWIEGGEIGDAPAMYGYELVGSQSWTLRAGSATTTTTTP